jgi:hypothetical protein
MLKCAQKGEPKTVTGLMKYAREWFGPHHEPGETALRAHMDIILKALRTGKPP